VAEKRQKPTPKRLRDARKQGEVVRSADIVSAVVFIGVVVGLWVGGMFILRHFHAAISYGARIAAARDPGLDIGVFVERSLHDWLIVSLPVLGLAGLCGIAGAFFQVGGIMAWSRLKPDMNRLNPAQGLKRMFSTRNLINLLKMVCKTLCLTTVLYVVVRWSLDVPLKAGYAATDVILAVAARLVMTVFGWAAVVYAFMAMIDYAHEHYEFTKQHRMSIEEIRREYKEVEGDPLNNARRRWMARELQFDALVDRVKLASVVVHSGRAAVALHYAGPNDVPRVIARGEGEVAARIRQYAEQYLVPHVQNAGLAHKLYQRVGLDQFIDRTLFREVSELLQWGEGKQG
jgi:type III secretion protein U